MDLTRRKFLTLVGGSAAGAVLFQACGVPEAELIVEAPVEMPEDMVTGIDNWYATLCPNCTSQEGIVVRVMEGRAKKVEGNVDYPVNQGKHGVRCEAAVQGLYHPDRISAPLVRLGARGEGRWEEISWTDAIARLANSLGQIGDRSSVILATEPVGGHLGKVVERFASRTGVRHMPYETLDETNLRISMKQVYGLDDMPDFDIGSASYLLTFGADFLSTWGSPVRYARAYGHFRQGDRERGTHVHVEPRLSTTAASADEWVYVNPGWEGHVALAIASVIVEKGLGDSAAAAALTDNGAIDLSRYAPERIADRAGVSAKKLREIAEGFAAHPPALAIGGGSAGAHSNGLTNLNAIYSLNHLVGSVGKSGGVIPNPPSPVRDVTGSPGASPYRDWQGLVGEMNAGNVSALLVNRANPVYGMPVAAGFRQALLGRSGGGFNVPLIVSFSGMMDDTSSLADLVLPENHGLEDWGDSVPSPGPGYHAFGLRQPVVRPFFEGRGVHLGTRNFGDALIGVAQTMEIDLGLEGESFKEVLQSGVEGLFARDRGSVRAPRLPVVLERRPAARRLVGHDCNVLRPGAVPVSPRGDAGRARNRLRPVRPGAVFLDWNHGRQGSASALAPGDSRPHYHCYVADVGGDQHGSRGGDGHQGGRRSQVDRVQWTVDRGPRLSSPRHIAGRSRGPDGPGTRRWGDSMKTGADLTSCRCSTPWKIRRRVHSPGRRRA